MKLGKRTSRKHVTIGVEAPLPDGGTVLVPIAVVPKDPSKYTPHQGAREKARRLKQQEKHAA